MHLVAGEALEVRDVVTQTFIYDRHCQMQAEDNFFGGGEGGWPGPAPKVVVNVGAENMGDMPGVSCTCNSSQLSNGQFKGTVCSDMGSARLA